MPVTTATGLALNPTFSPDGNTLAYSSDQSGGFEIYAKPLAGGGRELQLTDDGNQNMEPAWSPDGKFIAYHSAKRGGLWLMPALGGAPTQLTFDHGDHWPFGWPPDGDKIAFAGSRNGVWNLYWISRAGNTQRQLTGNTRLNTILRVPDWSPLGNQIIYERVELTGNINLMHLK